MGGAGEAGGMSEAKVFAGTSDRPRNHIRRESPPRKRRKAELKTRIAKHMSGRVRTPDAAMLSSYETITKENTATQATGGGTQAANCGAPERTRPTSWRSHVTEYANILWQHRYVSTESEKCPVERPLPGQNAHFE